MLRVNLANSVGKDQKRYGVHPLCLIPLCIKSSGSLVITGYQKALPYELDNLISFNKDSIISRIPSVSPNEPRPATNSCTIPPISIQLLPSCLTTRLSLINPLNFNTSRHLLSAANHNIASRVFGIHCHKHGRNILGQFQPVVEHAARKQSTPHKVIGLHRHRAHYTKSLLDKTGPR
ncbi:HTH-type transcriptional activator TtdR [Striga asiatica]|uniref:HTH-type transcriptional activator TtdR n=1 Tax=Striga asiatica TaxID=4170 RepID=A0A5A7QA86_STRAF|nr:HTH-type transcriptional activator TtdR [Striga asiatica]